MEPLSKVASLKRRVGYTRTVTRVLSSHYPTSLPPESLNKRIVSDDSLSRKTEECVKRKERTHKNNIKCVHKMCASDRLPVDRMQQRQPSNT